MSTRFIKVFRDLRMEFGRSTMLITAIFIGASAVGIILGTDAVLKREMKRNYMATVPASATLETEDSISINALNVARSFEGIRLADRRATITARMQVFGRWYPILLFVIDDFGAMNTNKFVAVSGESVPLMGHMLVEQTALGVMNAREGDSITVKHENVHVRLKISGTVHDPGLAPAWQEQAGYGYISLSTLRLLIANATFNQLRVVVSEKADSREHIETISRALAERLGTMHTVVHEIQIPSPGRHPHEGQLTTVMAIFAAFSVLILILASILVSTVMETVMVKEIRQIGVMKTIGGRTSQIFGIYACIVAILAIVACVLAVPTARIGAAAFYSMLAGLLNITIYDKSIPVWTTLMSIVVGTVIPLLASALPVLRGSRITVKEAITNFGSLGLNRISKAFSRVSEAIIRSQVLCIAVRNVFRQQRRLLMTVLLLAIAGAVYMTAGNVAKAWDQNLKRVYTQKQFDFDVRFTPSADTTALSEELKRMQGIRKFEFWSMVSAAIESNDQLSITRTYPDKGHGSFTIAGVPEHSTLLNPTVKEGEWLSNAHTNGIVLNQLAVSQFNNAVPGSEITLMAEGVPTRWRIIGITEDIGTPATAYVLMDALKAQRDAPLNTLRVAYSDRSYDNAIMQNEAIETILKNIAAPVALALPVWVLRNAVAAHMKILVDTLITLSLLMAIVGTLTLASSMSISILERTREFGVLRTIGATPRRIIAIVVYEVALIAALSVVVALPLSLVLSGYLSQLVGALSFRTSLSLAINYTGVLEWLGLLAVVGMVASITPSLRVNAITIREAIAFE